MKSAYQKNYEDRIVNNPERNAIVSRLARYCVKKKGKYVIILVQRIRHLQNLSRRLEDVPHRLVYGEKEVTDRQVSTRKFEKGKIKLIIANQVFKKGVDIKRVDVIIDCAAMRSQNDAIQKFGRGVRLHSDKRGLLYFDIADTDQNNSRNNFRKASRRRKSAYVATGIRVQDYRWDYNVPQLYRKAEAFLEKELKRKV